MTRSATEAADVAEKYYDSSDADAFYSQIWGGEDIHIGLYESTDDSIVTASRRTVAEMAARLPNLGSDTVVLDIGSGYGGAARYLAKTYDCRVTCVNLSEAQNTRNRRLTAAAGLGERIEVVHARFERLPLARESYDVVWSQDAILHSGDRRRTLEEVRRVLRPGGQFVFTDPMQADRCPKGVLVPVYARLDLEDLCSPRFYRTLLRELGFRELGFEDLTQHLVRHYARVRYELERRSAELARRASPGYLASMKEGLGHWIKADGHLRWGIFCFQR